MRDLHRLKVASEKLDLILEILDLLEYTAKMIANFTNGYGNKESFKKLIENSANIKALVDNINEFISVYKRLEDVVSVNKNINEIVDVSKNKDKLLVLPDKLTELFTEYSESLETQNERKEELLTQISQTCEDFKAFIVKTKEECAKRCVELNAELEKLKQEQIKDNKQTKEHNEKTKKEIEKKLKEVTKQKEQIQKQSEDAKVQIQKTKEQIDKLKLEATKLKEDAQDSKQKAQELQEETKKQTDEIKKQTEELKANAVRLEQEAKQKQKDIDKKEKQLQEEEEKLKQKELEIGEKNKEYEKQLSELEKLKKLNLGRFEIAQGDLVFFPRKNIDQIVRLDEEKNLIIYEDGEVPFKTLKEELSFSSTGYVYVNPATDINTYNYFLIVYEDKEIKINMFEILNARNMIKISFDFSIQFNGSRSFQISYEGTKEFKVICVRRLIEVMNEGVVKVYNAPMELSSFKLVQSIDEDFVLNANTYEQRIAQNVSSSNLIVLKANDKPLQVNMIGSYGAQHLILSDLELSLWGSYLSLKLKDRTKEYKISDIKIYEWEQ